MKRYLTSVLVLLIMFSILWYMQNSIYISHPNDQHILLIMNGSLQGYNSLRVLAILSLIFLLFMNMLTVKESSSFFIRYKYRLRLFHNRAMNIFCSSIIFVTSFLIVNVVFSLVYIGHDVMLESHFYLITFLNGIAMVLFYFWIGLLTKVLEDWLHSKNISVVIAFIIVMLIYFIDLPFWVPFDDMRIYEAMLSGLWTLADILFIYARQFGIVIILYVVGKIIFSDKDFIFYEK
ncbi:WxPxxD family membrane protein [Priestia megaterium]|uniref:WxPxxD family membrane protein n=1 Tax=Priestia megaterium TaxID=1404 RepID=UPI001BEBAC65|nr:WxPxxD family membrane protein [Priestia megaterium]MBT2259803.1 WxPxxD family membrane protein [Priestia megaterium]